MSDPPLSPRKQGDIVPVILLTGAVGAGKTTALNKHVRDWRESGRDVRGILAYRVFEGEQLVGYDLEIIGEDKRIILARKSGTGLEKIGPFVFSDDALAQGRRALKASATADVVVVDEIGPLELAGGGWSEEVKWLLRESNAVMVLVVREGLVDEIRQWLQNDERPIHVFSIEEMASNRFEKLMSCL